MEQMVLLVFYVGPVSMVLVEHVAHVLVFQLLIALPYGQQELQDRHLVLRIHVILIIKWMHYQIIVRLVLQTQEAQTVQVPHQDTIWVTEFLYFAPQMHLVLVELLLLHVQMDMKRMALLVSRVGWVSMVLVEHVYHVLMFQLLIVPPHGQQELQDRHLALLILVSLTLNLMPYQTVAILVQEVHQV
jgi:hypothetical protein